MPGGIDNYTKLMLHMDGADASTTFTDSSFLGLTVTPVSNAQVDTGVTDPWGGTAGMLLLDGVDDRLTVNDASFAPGTGDFTFDGWVRLTASGYPGFFQLSDTAGGVKNSKTNSLAAGMQDTTHWSMYAANNEYASSSTTINTGQLYHWALERYSGVTTMYINGQAVVTHADTTNYTCAYLGIGARWATGCYLNGHIDEFRYSVGVARFKGNFTPPTAPYDSNMFCADILGLAEQLSSLGTFPRTLAEIIGLAERVFYPISLTLSDTLTFTEFQRITEKIADALTLADAATKNWIILAYDYIRMTESITTHWNGKENIADSLVLEPYVQAAKIYLKTIADVLAFADSVPKPIMGLLLAEILKMNDTGSGKLTAHPSLAEMLLFGDLSRWSFPLTAADTLQFSETLIRVWIGAVIASDALSIADAAPSVTRTMNQIVISGIRLADTSTSRATFKNVLADTLNLDIRLILDGEVYQCWTLNTDELYPSIYTNFNFNSYAQAGGSVYGAKDDGIYLIGGADDGGTEIKTGVQVNLYNMGTRYRKRLYTAFFGMVGTQPAVKAITEEGEVQYFVLNERILPAKGHTGRHWKFNLTQMEAVDFMEITPIILSR